MAYATSADLIPRRMTGQELAELTNDAGGEAVDQANVNGILTEASATVDSYCRERYSLPLQASEQVKGVVLDIAVYKLFLRRRRVSPDVLQAYQDAIKFLQDVAAGKAGLDQAANSLPQTSAQASLPTQKDEKFSDDDLAGFV